MGSTPQSPRSLRIGVDVGGTNTDAVVLNIDEAGQTNRGVLAFYKTATTSPDVTDGIETAISKALSQAGNCGSEVDYLIIGTTHFLNAVIEHDSRRLSKVAVIRLSKSFTKDIPPFSDFPPTLANILKGYHGFIDGGIQIDGSQEAPLDEKQILEQCKAIRELGIKAVVISGVFSPIDKHFKQEDHVRKIMQEQLPDVDFVCSSEVSNLGLLERENASILNAAILKFARRTVRGFRAAMKRLGLHCPLLLSQNDGTVMDAISAARLPIKTFSSGPTNSMRGAAYLGLTNFESRDEEPPTIIVVDIGGTTTDCGVLLPSGFPRTASAYVEVAGITINFAMPHIESAGLGGGSIVREQGSDITVGPDSVGHQLTSRSTVFGGDVLTTTDIAVASGFELGDPLKVSGIGLKLIQQTQEKAKLMLERLVDRLKLTPEPLPVLLVGGGSIICPPSLEGVSEIIKPKFHSVANAVGAAISRVGETIDAIYANADKTESNALDDAKERAIQKAISAGADPNTVKIVDIDVLPIPYVSGQVRVVVKAAGDLSPRYTSNAIVPASVDDGDIENLEDEGSKADLLPSAESFGDIDVVNYEPKVVKNAETGIQEWLVSEVDVEWMRYGCYILGCGGGGSPKAEYLKLRDQIRAGNLIRIIDVSSLHADALIYWGGCMGSPAVSIERLNSSEYAHAIRDLMEYLGHDSFDAVMGVEIGGANGLQSLVIGSTHAYNRPVLDADWMGRAYPTAWQTTIAVYETGQLTPCTIASGDGKTIIMSRSPDDEMVDRALRAVCSEMGSQVGMACKPATPKKVKDYGVLNTLSLAWRIGRSVARARQESTLHTVADQIIDAVGGPGTAKILFRGKIVAVEKRLHKGHSYGEITVKQTPIEEEESQHNNLAVAEGGVVKIPFKNENIYAKHTGDDGKEAILASVPDLIAVLDSRTGLALGVPEYRYGLMVTVLGLACSPRWTDTPRGLEYGGPKAFGYEFEYTPIGVYIEPKSVISEYAR